MGLLSINVNIGYGSGFCMNGFINKKEACKLNRSVHVNCQEKGRRKANYGYVAETLETLFPQNLLSTPITNFRCHDVLDSLH